MKSTIVDIEKWGTSEKVIITYKSKEELDIKLKSLNEECEKENSKMSIDFNNFKIRTL